MAAEESVFLRCTFCGALNRLPAKRLSDEPKCGKCKSTIEVPRTPVPVNTGNFDRQVVHWPGTVLVEFWAPRCGICLSLTPFLERLAREKGGRLKVALINVETEWLLAQRFDIRSTPVFMVFRKGEKINELFGALPLPELKAWIESATVV